MLLILGAISVFTAGLLAMTHAGIALPCILLVLGTASSMPVVLYSLFEGNE